MEYSVGKIINFDGFTGEIQSGEDVLTFLDTDVIEEVDPNLPVMFRKEIEGEIKRAYFVKNYVPKKSEE